MSHLPVLMHHTCKTDSSLSNFDTEGELFPVSVVTRASIMNALAPPCRLPSPMSNPGLTPEWAKVILDCHRKRFVDECAICFSEISHNFRLHDAAVAAAGDTADDVVSCGTSESEHSGGASPVPSVSMLSFLHGCCCGKAS